MLSWDVALCHLAVKMNNAQSPPIASELKSNLVRLLQCLLLMLTDSESNQTRIYSLNILWPLEKC